MDDLVGFSREIEEAIGFIQIAIDIGDDITHDDWKDMNDYIDNLRKAFELMKIPQQIQQAIDNYEQFCYDCECLADRNSY